jgi:hypothetical protein
MISMLPALRISSDDGSIKICGFDHLITKDITKSVAVNTFEALYKSAIDHKNGYEWATFQNVSFGGRPCGFSLCFYLGSLNLITFGVSVPDAELHGGWPTRATSERAIAFVRSELTKQLHRDFASGSHQFPWGVVSSIFDEKGYQASSSLRYSDRPVPTN